MQTNKSNHIRSHHDQRPQTTVQEMERKYYNIAVWETSRNLQSDFPQPTQFHKAAFLRHRSNFDDQHPRTTRNGIRSLEKRYQHDDTQTRRFIQH